MPEERSRYCFDFVHCQQITERFRGGVEDHSVTMNCYLRQHGSVIVLELVVDAADAHLTPTLSHWYLG